MAGTGYYLSEADRRWLRGIKPRLDVLLTTLGGQGPVSPEPRDPAIHGARITATTKTAGRYPGFWSGYDANAEAWVDNVTLQWVFTAGTTAGSPTLTNCSSTAGFAAGDWVTGPGIPQGAVVTAVGANTLTPNVNATAAASGVPILDAQPLLSGNTNTTFTGDIASGSPVITNVPTTAYFFVGDPVLGPNITANAVILSIDSASQITLTAPALTNLNGATLQALHGVWLMEANGQGLALNTYYPGQARDDVSLEPSYVVWAGGGGPNYANVTITYVNDTFNVTNTTINYTGDTFVWADGSWSLTNVNVTVVSGTWVFQAAVTVSYYGTVNFYGPAAFYCCVEYVPDVETLTAGSYNDWTPTACAPLIYVLTPTGDVTLTGMKPSSGCTYQVVVLKNVGTYNLRISCGDTASAAANRFKMPAWWNYDSLTPGLIVLAPDESITVWHDDTGLTTAHWNVLGLDVAMKARGAGHSPGFVRDSGTSGADTDYWARNATWKPIPAASANIPEADQATQTVNSVTPNGGWQDVTGLNSLPLTAGKWVIWVDVSGDIESTAAKDTIQLRLHDGTNPVADSVRTLVMSVAQIGGVTQRIFGNMCLMVPYTAAGSVSIKLQAQLTASGTASGSVIGDSAQNTGTDWGQMVALQYHT